MSKGTVTDMSERLKKDKRAWVCTFRFTTKPLCIIVACALTLTVFLYPQDAWAKNISVQEPLTKTVQGLHEALDIPEDESILAQQDKLPAGDTVADWLAFDLARLNIDSNQAAYLEALQEVVTNAYADPETKLGKFEATPWSTMILTVAALGGNPTAFGVDAEGKPINLVDDGIYQWTQTNDLGLQGTNALMYALSAADCLDYAEPEGALYTTEQIVESILEAQAPDGSFALMANSKTGSADLTGMALAALSQHTDVKGVSDAIEAALVYLSETQDGGGGYSTEGFLNAESCAMVIVGLAAVGVDPRADSRFIKNDNSVFDALLTFQRADGTFRHSLDDPEEGEVEFMPTEQALRAMTALVELEQGGDGNVYTFDVKLTLTDEPSVTSEMLPWLPLGIVVGVVCVVGLSVFIARRRRAKLTRS